MINGFQNASLSSRLGIPMIYGIDAVHGHNNIYKATIFPHNVGLGATRYDIIYLHIHMSVTTFSCSKEFREFYMNMVY
jgi:beta-glucosidase-like glycosyl hydrolase